MLGLADFEGDWRLDRWIEDRLSGRPGRFEGTARFDPGDDGLLYREEGTLRLGDGPPMVARRDYLWHPDGQGIEVRFPDGRPFHHFRAEGLSHGTDHPCGRDLYRVAYDLRDWPRWSVEWTVTGPAKDYTLVTRYVRPWELAP